MRRRTPRKRTGAIALLSESATTAAKTAAAELRAGLGRVIEGMADLAKQDKWDLAVELAQYATSRAADVARATEGFRLLCGTDPEDKSRRERLVDEFVGGCEQCRLTRPESLLPTVRSHGATLRRGAPQRLG
jgi:hypothetical protein